MTYSATADGDTARSASVPLSDRLLEREPAKTACSSYSSQDDWMDWGSRDEPGRAGRGRTLRRRRLELTGMQRH